MDVYNNYMNSTNFTIIHLHDKFICKISNAQPIINVISNKFIKILKKKNITMYELKYKK